MRNTCIVLIRALRGTYYNEAKRKEDARTHGGFHALWLGAVRNF